MTWVLSHLPHLGLFGLALVVASFWSSPDGTARPVLRWGGAMVLLGVVGCVIYVMKASPGREETVDQDQKPKPSPVPTPSRLEPLRQAWDSEDPADWPVAELLASMSETAYQTPVDAEEGLLKFGFDRIKTFVDASMVGYVISKDDMTVVVFRGTDDRFDWFTNLSDADIQTPHGAIHRGFYNSYQPLKPQIVKLIKAANPKHLWITGHSLGGALAVVCAYDLVANEKQHVDGLITFGQPMIARRNLAAFVDKALLGKFAHYVNDADIVPRVPPGHSHCGSLVWFTKNGIRRSKPKRPLFGATPAEALQWADEDEVTPLTDQEFEQYKANMRAANEEPEWTPDGKRVYRSSYPFIEDHMMDQYLEKIRAVHQPTDSR